MKVQPKSCTNFPFKKLTYLLVRKGDVFSKVDAIIPFTMETQMHTAGPICMVRTLLMLCGAYCECHLCDGDAQIWPCILYFYFHYKRNREIDLSLVA